MNKTCGELIVIKEKRQLENIIIYSATVLWTLIENCKRAKKKCSGAVPCARCVTLKIPDTCTYSERKQCAKGQKRGPYKKKGKGQLVVIRDKKHGETENLY